MPNLLFVTSNPLKITLAQAACQKQGIVIETVNLDIPEIQAELGDVIAKHKAEQAYAMLKRPLVVSDDSWYIAGLNGFPGPYMKSMHNWLTTADFLNLTAPLKDRRITLRQILVYQDSKQQKVFSNNVEGVLLEAVRGSSVYPHLAITSFDNGSHSLAELIEADRSILQNQPTPWEDLCRWLKSR